MYQIYICLLYTSTSTIAEKQIENATSEKLIKEAEKKAAESPAESVANRKKKVVQANTQRIKTEAETRLLIDEQLRKVGWEDVYKRQLHH